MSVLIEFALYIRFFYIKPQPLAESALFSVGCISVLFYIKPQHEPFKRLEISFICAY